MLPEENFDKPNGGAGRHKAWVGVLILIFLGASIYSVRLSIVAHEAVVGGRRIQSELTASVKAAKNLDLERAYLGMNRASNELSAITSNIESEPVVNFSFGALPAFFKDLTALSKNALGLGGDFLQVLQNGPTWIMDRQGELLIDRLYLIKDRLQTLRGAGAAIKSSGAAVGITLPGQTAEADGVTFQAEQILQAFLGWLERPSDRRLALFFQNISEMQNPLRQVKSWFVLLDPAEGVEISDRHIKSYDMAILDPDNHPLLGQAHSDFIPIAQTTIEQSSR